jgi:hypothetical protein
MRQRGLGARVPLNSSSEPEGSLISNNQQEVSNVPSIDSSGPLSVGLTGRPAGEPTLFPALGWGGPARLVAGDPDAAMAGNNVCIPVLVVGDIHRQRDHQALQPPG